MPLDFSPWIALVLGILIGWLSGWMVDMWFERHRRAAEKRRIDAEERRRLRNANPPDAQSLVLLPEAAEPVPGQAAGAAIEEEPLPPYHLEHLSDDLATPAVEVEVAADEVDTTGLADADAHEHR